MKKLCLAVVTLLCLSAMAFAAEKSHLRANLNGLQEVVGPATVITDATGTFIATVNNDTTITYTLSYKNLSSHVQQAHIHVGASKISGGISIFLCSNLGNGPAGTPACPDDATHSGTVTRTVSAADVIGPSNQGVGVGDMKNVVRAIASQVTYANVHTDNHPAGEIRGQIRQLEDDEDGELPGAR
jgi:CHRD domain